MTIPRSLSWLADCLGWEVLGYCVPSYALDLALFVALWGLLVTLGTRASLNRAATLSRDESARFVFEVAFGAVILWELLWFGAGVFAPGL